ncbi:MAG: T9SS type A sorting domain-containing protein [Chlorobi bacterium]|nr:T9SS type A sorting domain-containing protein [Chlorobiota bacterium]
MERQKLFRKTAQVLLVSLLILRMITVGNLFAQTQPAGSGTTSDPYQIATVDNLIWLNANSSEWDKTYIQTADIDMSSIANWEPMGDYTLGFSGNYDGQNFKLLNLNIDKSADQYIGFFGYVKGVSSSSLSVIKNMILENVTIVGNQDVGALSGSVSNALLDSIIVTGKVTGGYGCVGGIIGRLYSEGSNYYSKLTNSYANCTVSGTSWIGGLVGDIPVSSGGYAEVSYSYTLGEVSGVSDVGGLIGYNHGTISNSYSMASVTRTSGTNAGIGSFAGRSSGGTISYCFSTGTVYCGDATDKGFVGDEYDPNTYTDNFFDSEVTQQATAIGATSKTTAEMKTETTFTDNSWDFVGETANGTNDYWTIDAVTNSGYPFLSWQPAANANDLTLVSVNKPVKNFNDKMPVEITIKNSGTNDQTNFPVSYTFNGNTINKTYPGTLASGASVNYTFTQTIDLSTEGIYDFSVKTALANDENTLDDEYSTQINSYTGDNTLSFDGTDDFVSVPNNSALKLSGSFTVECWFYAYPPLKKGNQDIISKHANSGGRTGYALEYNGTSITAVAGTGASWQTVSRAVTNEQWHHVAMVYENNSKVGGNQLYLYVDENPINSVTFTDNILSNNQDLYIGASQFYDNYFYGMIDEVRIWNFARSSGDISNDMNVEIDPQSAGLIAYYNFNRGIATGDNTSITYVPDMTNNNYHGMLNNFTLTGSNSNFVSSCPLDFKNPVPDVADLPDLTGECEIANLTAPTATENCSGTLAGTYDVTLPITHSSQILWTYDDGNGHIATQTQNVIISDNTPPTISCVANQNVTADTSNTYTVSGTEFDPDATDDNCGVASVINDFNSANTLDGAKFPAGTTTVTWTVTDNAGNTTDCNFDVTVNAYVGINNISNNVDIYPNPVNNFLTIITNSDNSQIQIIDITGKTIVQKILNSKHSELSLSNLNPGIYFAKINTNNKVYIRKFIKK